MLAEAALAIGLPAGVLNIVAGDGKVVGEAISAHPGIDMVSFTGSVAAGRRVASVAGDGIKKVCLELGGKSACVVLDDAVFEKAIPAGVNHALQNSGQTCSAWTRMLVPRSREDEAIERAVAQLAKLTVGDPFDAATRLGPLVSSAQRERVLGYIERGKAEGARLVAGGGRPAELATGYYVEPTIFADVDNRMAIAQEEIFGPVLAIIPYDSDDDAIAIANDSPYGLAGAVWSASTDRAMAVARRLRTGQVDVNGGPVQPAGAVWRLQAVRYRPGDRSARARRVLRAEGDSAVVDDLGAGSCRRPRRRLLPRARRARPSGGRGAAGGRRRSRGLARRASHGASATRQACCSSARCSWPSASCCRSRRCRRGASGWSASPCSPSACGASGAPVVRIAHQHVSSTPSFAMGTLHGLAGSSHLYGVLPSLMFPSRVDSLLVSGRVRRRRDRRP